jgi:ankyrin repeat protein
MSGRWIRRAGYGTLVLLSLVGVAAAGAAGADDRRLADAVEQQDQSRVAGLLQQHVDVNAAQPDGTTALHWAVYWDDLATAERLLVAGARVNAVSDLGVTPLSLACTNASAAMVTRLLAAGALSAVAGSIGEPPLMTCARTGNLAAVKAMLAHGGEVNGREPDQQQTALMWAASEGHADIVQTLIENGANVNAASTSGFTPLLFAAREGHQAVAQLLLKAGANVNATAQDGTTALLVATVRGNTAAARDLLEQGADPNASGPGYTALHWAAGSWETELTGPRGIVMARDKEWQGLRGVATGKLELVTALLEHGADPNARLVKAPPRFGFSSFTSYQRTFLTGATPFLLAALAADVEVMRALAAGGADPGLATDEKTTPLMVAAGLGRILQETRVTSQSSLQAVTLAWQLGGDVNAVNDAGNCALHGAAHIRSDEVVQFLADQGAALNVKNKPSNFLLFELPAETPLAVAERTVQPGQAPIHLRTSTGDLLRKLGASN